MTIYIGFIKNKHEFLNFLEKNVILGLTSIKIMVE
jgi:hypothetical protein